MKTDDAVDAFEIHYSERPEFLVRAPGRVNLIGDHTDYTGGLVLPIAIDRSILVAVRRAEGAVARVHSVAFGESVHFTLAEAETVVTRGWRSYVVGVFAVLLREGIPLPGVDLWIGGDLPVAAGLASSAALEVGIAAALSAVSETPIEPARMADLCRQAENEFAGSACGIMDQLCCTSATAGDALFIDCTSENVRAIPLDLGDATIVVVNTGVTHSIAGAEYAARRRDCSRALHALRQANPDVISLRDLDPAGFVALSGHLNDTLGRRVSHVVTENARVLHAVRCLEQSDAVGFGRLMIASHESLRDAFEVSCAELDAVVETCLGVDGVYGARMTGGGFGGCVVVLVRCDAVEPLSRAVCGMGVFRPREDSPAFAVCAAVGVRTTRIAR